MIIIIPNSEISEIAARLKKNKIRQKQKKIFQNWYSTELIIAAVRKSKKKKKEKKTKLAVLGCPLKFSLLNIWQNKKKKNSQGSLEVHVL